MVQVTFHYSDGHQVNIQTKIGTNVMRAALDNGVDGIIGECGGQCMCGTCHVYVRPEYRARIPNIAMDEEEMLSELGDLRDPESSRLSCQILMTEVLDGLQVDVPEHQI